jgi:hypothetical protein
MRKKFLFSPGSIIADEKKIMRMKERRRVRKEGKQEVEEEEILVDKGQRREKTFRMKVTERREKKERNK